MIARHKENADQNITTFLVIIANLKSMNKTAHERNHKQCGYIGPAKREKEREPKEIKHQI